MCRRAAALLLLGFAALAAAADDAAAAPDAPPMPLDPEEGNKVLEQAGFKLNEATGLYDAPEHLDKEGLSRQVLLPNKEADMGAFTNMLLSMQHGMAAAEYGEHSIPAGITFLIKEYQQLVADTLAILGISQPLIEMDWLAQHVQYKIDEFQTLLAHISPTLANHVSINNPFYTDKTMYNGKTNTGTWFSYGATFAKHTSATWMQVAPALFNVQPCLINIGVTGASASPRLINITPRIIQVSAKGASMDPKLIKMDLAVIRVKPIGFMQQPRLINVAPVVLEASPKITIKDDKVKQGPKTEAFGGKIFDFSGKGATVDWTNGKTPLPRKDQLPPLPKVPVFNKKAMLYQG